MDDLKKFSLDDSVYETRLSRKFERRTPWMPRNPKLMQAQIPGVIQAVTVRPGQKVRRGEPLLVLEAMKMRNSLTSPLEGTVRSVPVRIGQMVMKGQLLVEFE
jgi:biotin carboxyl carrier protein